MLAGARLKHDSRAWHLGSSGVYIYNYLLFEIVIFIIKNINGWIFDKLQVTRYVSSTKDTESTRAKSIQENALALPISSSRLRENRQRWVAGNPLAAVDPGWIGAGMIAAILGVQVRQMIQNLLEKISRDLHALTETNLPRMAESRLFFSRRGKPGHDYRNYFAICALEASRS